MIDLDLFRRAVYESRDGITVADATQPDSPLIFVNPAFERMTGYSAKETLGRNCRFLQGDQHDQPGLTILREALKRGEPCIVTLQNFRKDGTLFWNELSISPIHDAEGRLTHFVGIQKDVSGNKLAEFALRESKELVQHTRERLEHEALTDTLTGLYNRRYLQTYMPEILHRAVDEARPIGVMLMDLDHFKNLNDTAGHAAGDDALRLVGDCLKQSRRSGRDIAARYGGEEFAMVCDDLSEEQAAELAARLVDRVRCLEIPNPGVDSDRLTISVGWVSIVPDINVKYAHLWEAADQALYQAKRDGRNRAARGGALITSR